MNLRILAAVLALVATAAPAHAQRGTPRVQPGQTVAGTLTDRDPAYSDGRPFRVYRLQAQADSTYLLTVRSPDFAPQLMVMRETGPITEVVGASLGIDYRGNASLSFPAPASGSYLLVVSASSSQVDSVAYPYDMSMDTTMAPVVVPVTDTVITSPLSMTDTVVMATMDTMSYADTSVFSVDTTLVGYDTPPMATTGAFELSVRRFSISLPEPRHVALGDSVEGRFGEESAGDPMSQQPAHWYIFSATAGQRLRLSVYADSVYALLSLGRLVEGRFVSLDDLDPGTDTVATYTSTLSGSMARPGVPLYITIPEDGEYVAEVSGINLVAGGVYTAVFREAPPRVERPARPIAMGETVTDSLWLHEGWDERGLYDDWIYDGRAGERIVVTMEHDSSGLDPVLAVGTIDAGEFRPLERNDDTDGLNSRVTLTLPETRQYVVRAMAYSGTEGGYSLRLATTTPAGPRTLQTGRIAAGEEKNGVLDTSDAALELDGSAYEHWIYRAAGAGERITVTLESGEFDTVLSIGRMRNGTTFEEFTRNDDAPEDLATENYASRVVAVLPGAGEYVIRVNTFGPEEAGAYVLRVEREPPSR